MKQTTFFIIVSMCSALVIHSIFIMTFSQQGIIINSRLQRTYEEMIRIEQEMETLSSQAEVYEVRELQQQMNLLYREAEQLMQQQPAGRQAHQVGILIGVLSGVVLFLSLRIRALRKEERHHDH